jgi:quaternary ammonium compound-resistance protein SugE
MSTSWVLLVLAGLLEVAWAVGLKSTHGFTRLWPSLWVGAAIAGSLYLLALALRGLPIAVAYAVWMGIGAAGTALVSAVFLREALNPLQWLFFAMLIAGVAGMKLAH